MNVDRHRIVSLARAVLHEIRVENVTFLAGSIAYHAFVSLLPLLLLVVLVLSVTGNTGLESAFESVVRAALTPDAGEELIDELRRANRSSLSLVGVGVLAWGALRVFRGLDTAFSAIYETEGENDFLDQLTDGLLVLVLFAAAVLAAAALQRAVPSTVAGPAWAVLHRAALTAALTATLLPMYYVFPDADVSVREVLPGAVFAALGLMTFESLFRVYVEWSGRQPEQSVIAAILVFLTWLYVSGLVILVGAAINAVFANRSADVTVDPVFGTYATPERPAEDEVVGAIEELNGLLADPAEFTVTVGDRSVAFPAPQRVETDTEASVFGGTDIGVALRWSGVRASSDDRTSDGETGEEGDTTDAADADATTPRD